MGNLLVRWTVLSGLAGALASIEINRVASLLLKRRANDRLARTRQPIIHSVL